MARDEVYRFRLTADEQKRLSREADQKGISKADLIRDALGWTRTAKSAPSTAAVRDLAQKAPAKKPVDREAEPGKAAIEELAQRIRNREGLTTPHSKQEARKRLKEGT